MNDALTREVDIGSHLAAVLTKCTTILGLTESGLQIQTFCVRSIRMGFSCRSRTAANSLVFVLVPT
jgi:hypothetical protein